MKYDHLISNHSVLCQRNTNEIWPFDQYITIRSYVRDTNKISPSYVYAKELALLDFAAVDFDGSSLSTDDVDLTKCHRLLLEALTESN